MRELIKTRESDVFKTCGKPGVQISLYLWSEAGFEGIGFHLLSSLAFTPVFSSVRFVYIVAPIRTRCSAKCHAIYSRVKLCYL